MQSAFPRQRLTMRYTVLRRGSRTTERTRHDRFYAQPTARRDNNRKLGPVLRGIFSVCSPRSLMFVPSTMARSTWLPSLSYAAGKKATACDKFMRAIFDNPRF